MSENAIQQFNQFTQTYSILTFENIVHNLSYKRGLKFFLNLVVYSNICQELLQSMDISIINSPSWLNYFTILKNLIIYGSESVTHAMLKCDVS